MNKAEKSGNNVNSQKIRKYLSSPKREPPLPLCCSEGVLVMLCLSYSHQKHRETGHSLKSSFNK